MKRNEYAPFAWTDQPSFLSWWTSISSPYLCGPQLGGTASTRDVRAAACTRIWKGRSETRPARGEAWRSRSGNGEAWLGACERTQPGRHGEHASGTPRLSSTICSTLAPPVPSYTHLHFALGRVSITQLCVLAAVGELLGGAVATTSTTGMQSMVAGLGASAMPDDSDSNQQVLF